MIFKDRTEAGRLLSQKLLEFKKKKNVLVIGLARGGVIVAFEIAKLLDLPLDISIIRKVGAPGNPELALGAISETGEGIFNESVIEALKVSSSTIDQIVAQEKKEIERRLKTYRTFCPAVDSKGKTIILVDDGIATGASLKVAIASLKKRGVFSIIVAVPVAAPESLDEIKKDVDRVVCLYSPLNFMAVGQFYEFFEQTTDQEIKALFTA